MKKKNSVPTHNNPSKHELTAMLGECRDLLMLCTHIDKSGQCQALVDKVDEKIDWKKFRIHSDKLSLT